MDLAALLDTVPAQGGPAHCVGAIVLDGRGRAFAQLRARHRRLYPGCWEVLGGHVEAGESLRRALEREVAEESGWTLRGVAGLLADHTWTGADGRVRRELDFLVTVEGDLARPRLERDRHPEFRWVGADELDLFDLNRAPGEHALRLVVATALAGQPGARRPAGLGPVYSSAPRLNAESRSWRL